MTEAPTPAFPTDPTAGETVPDDPDAGLRQLAAGTPGLPQLRAGQFAGMRALVAGRDVLACCMPPSPVGSLKMKRLPARTQGQKVR